MKALVAYLGQMKSRNEGAAKLLTIASAFTHVAGTFIKNYYKMTKGSNRPAPQQKRRREEAPLPPAPANEGWSNASDLRDASSRYPDFTGAGFYSPLSTPLPTSTSTSQPQQQQPHPPDIIPGSISSHSSTTTPLSTDIDFEVPAADVQAANFLRWPGHNHASQVPISDDVGDSGGSGSGSGSGGVMDHDAAGATSTAPAPMDYDIDLEALMAEPVGFQIQMEQASLRGPLEFDWFRALDSWDGHWPSS